MSEEDFKAFEKRFADLVHEVEVSKVHLIDAKQDIESIKQMLVGIFMILRTLQPKFSPFLSNSQKMEISEHIKFLGKTIMRLTEDGHGNE